MLTVILVWVLLFLLLFFPWSHCSIIFSPFSSSVLSFSSLRPEDDVIYQGVHIHTTHGTAEGANRFLCRGERTKPDAWTVSASHLPQPLCVRPSLFGHHLPAAGVAAGPFTSLSFRNLCAASFITVLTPVCPLFTLSSFETLWFVEELSGLLFAMDLVMSEVCFVPSVEDTWKL